MSVYGHEMQLKLREQHDGPSRNSAGKTEAAADALKIVVYHPDSDFGPTDEAHPMVNRTIINGVSVAGDQRYQTQEIA